MQVTTTKHTNYKDTPTTRTHQPARHKVQGMQVITTKARTTKAQAPRYAGNHHQARTSKARGSRHAGNHSNQGHEPARHEVQGIQVTTPTKDTPTRDTRFKVSR